MTTILTITNDKTEKLTTIRCEQKYIQTKEFAEKIELFAIKMALFCFGSRMPQVRILSLGPCGVSLKDLKSSFDDTPHFLFAEKVIQRSVRGRS